MSQTGIKTVEKDHAVLHVTDLERSNRFYIDLLGMTVNHESSWQSFLWCGDQQIALFQVDQGTTIKPREDPNHIALRLESGSYEEVKAHLEANGHKVMGRPGDDRCIYFDDPDGHRVQLFYPGARD